MEAERRLAVLLVSLAVVVVMDLPPVALVRLDLDLPATAVAEGPLLAADLAEAGQRERCRARVTEAGSAIWQYLCPA